MDRISSKIHHGKNIKRFREILGYKQEVLAIGLDITQQSVSEMEQKEVIEESTLKKVAKILHISVEAIEKLNEKVMVEYMNLFIKNVVNGENDNMEKAHEGRVIKLLREFLGISIEEFSIKLKCNLEEITKLEQKEIIEEETLKKIANIFGIPVEAITNFDEEGIINVVANTVNNNDTASYNSILNYQPIFNSVEKIAEIFREKEALYEKLLQEKNALIEKLSNK